MSAEYYNMCCRYKGRAVRITTRDGRTHRGIIRHVDKRSVYLQPFGPTRNLGGFGYGYGYGYGGFGLGIALGAIGTLALLPFFFW
ncbi:hypothetical protein [Oceanobacillus bengalensis]|uniref:Uncharacterized protein n=1 Tax=Oceanobacillus bengalensis TaxID=1435466 RepID=A0A494YVJ1_9BACI|nr:hypothetical protein [Oceanobacillus bengalensis]RKQ14153.1 hypothetical protein D8M05_14070 [Oceanobacillus bengalensis]